MKSKGFTLIELVSSLLISIICMGITFSMYIKARDITVKTLCQNELRATGIMVLEEFKESIRNAYLVDDTVLKDIERSINDNKIIKILLYVKKNNIKPYILAVKAGTKDNELHRIYIDEVVTKGHVSYVRSGDNVVCDNIENISIYRTGELLRIMVNANMNNENKSFTFFISRNRGDTN